MSYTINAHDGVVKEHGVATSGNSYQSTGLTEHVVSGTDMVEVNGVTTTRAAAEAAGLLPAGAPAVEAKAPQSTAPTEEEKPDEKTQEAIDKEVATQEAIKEHDALLDAIEQERLNMTVEGIVSGDLAPEDIVKPEAVEQYVSRAAEATGLEDPRVLAELLPEDQRQAAVRATINNDMAQLASIAKQGKQNAAAYVASPEFAAAVKEAGGEVINGQVVGPDGYSEDALEMLLSGRIQFV